MSNLELQTRPEDGQPPTEDGLSPASRRSARAWLYPSLVVASFLLGLLTSIIAWGGTSLSVAANGQSASAASSAVASEKKSPVDYAALMQQVNPPQGYKLPASYGNLGPSLLEGGAMGLLILATV